MAEFRAALREAAAIFGLTREGRRRNAAMVASARYVRVLTVAASAGLIVYLAVKHGPARWIGLAVWVVFAVASLVVWIRVDRRRRSG
jgi:uncharacterized membrane protein AbrB (regulator of aidB expression)